MINKLNNNYIINDNLKSIYEYDEYTLQELLCKMQEGINNFEEITTKDINDRIDTLQSELNNYVSSYAYLDNTTKECKFIAHRGYSALYPENTSIAFEKCKGRFWGIETDITSDKNGVWWCMHDTTVDRTTNGTGELWNMTTEEVKQLQIDGGNNSQYYTGEKVPLLERYLKVCSSIGCVPIIEIKSEKQYTDEELRVLINTIKNFGFENKAHIISFGLGLLYRIRQLNKNIILEYIVGDISEEYIQKCKELGNCLIDVNYPRLTKTFVDLCHREGVLVNCWTCDDYTKIENLKLMGVDFITTDYHIQGGY